MNKQTVLKDTIKRIRQRKAPEQRKAEISTTAYNLFSQKGYDEVSLEEIVSAVKITKGTFFYYFKTKRELFVYSVSPVLNGLFSTAENSSSKDFKEKYSVFLDEFTGLTGSSPLIIRDMLNLDEFRENHLKLLQQGIENKSLNFREYELYILECELRHLLEASVKVHLELREDKKVKLVFSQFIMSFLK